MTIRPTSALPVALAALIALAAAGCDRIWPYGSDAPAKTDAKSDARTDSKADAKADAKPAQTLAALPTGPAARPPAPSAPPAPPPPQRMTGPQQAEFDTWLVKTYLGCWKPPAQPTDSDPYVARVRLAFKPDGSLARTPKLVNPPSDPALKPHARSVIQAVQSCNPLPVPAQYRPFYEQWKTQTIQFNPQIAAR